VFCYFLLMSKTSRADGGVAAIGAGLASIRFLRKSVFVSFAVKQAREYSRRLAVKSLSSAFRACHGVAHAKPGVSWATIRIPAHPSHPWSKPSAYFVGHPFASIRAIHGKKFGIGD
jgi:hypothetical protein